MKRISSAIILLISLMYVSVDAKIYYVKHFQKNRQQIITEDINSALNFHEKRWRNKDIRELAKVLEVGEKECNINYKIMLGIIGLESRFDINANNKETHDYGLAQINKPNWNKLSRESKKILNKHKIRYNNNKYDISLNVMNGIVHLKDNRNELKRKKQFTFVTWVQSYNCGVRGTLTEDFAPKRKIEYWNTFVKKYKAI